MTPVSMIAGPRFRTLFAIALGFRTAVVLAGLALAAQHPASNPPEDGVSDHIYNAMTSGPGRVLEPWFHSDAAWYAAIAERGYAGTENRSGQRGVAFMPALSLCMAAAAAAGLDPFWAALVIVNIAAAAGSAVLARVATQLTGNPGVGVRTFVLIQAFPTSFFFSAPYNEAFGLLFTALACAAWLRDRPGWAAAFAAAGSLARVTGTALGVAAMGGWLCEDRTRSGFRRAVILALGSLIGLLLFWAYLGWAFGDPFANLKAHQAWGRKPLSIENPWLSIQSSYQRRELLEPLTALVFAALGIRSWVKRGAFWGILTLVPIGQMMMSGSFMSGHRVVLAALPAFIELADLLHNRLSFAIATAAFLYLQLFLINVYVHGQFAG